MSKTLAAGLSVAAAISISVAAEATLEIGKAPVVRHVIQSTETPSAKRQVAVQPVPGAGDDGVHRRRRRDERAWPGSDRRAGILAIVFG